MGKSKRATHSWPSDIKSPPPLSEKQTRTILHAASLNRDSDDPDERTCGEELIKRVQEDTRFLIRDSSGRLVFTTCPTYTAEKRQLERVLGAVENLAKAVRGLDVVMACVLTADDSGAPVDSVCAHGNETPGQGLSTERFPEAGQVLDLAQLEAALLNVKAACGRALDVMPSDDGAPDRPVISLAAYVSGRLARTFKVVRLTPRDKGSLTKASAGDTPQFVKCVLETLNLGSKYQLVDEAEVRRWIREYDADPEAAANRVADGLEVLRDHWRYRESFHRFLRPLDQPVRTEPVELLDDLVSELRETK